MKKDKFITDFEDVPTPRQKMPHLTLEERKLNFKEVELGFNEDIALQETSRCLSCRRCIGCGLCLAECDQQAIVYDQAEEYSTVEVDSIVVATGTESFDAKRKPELGYAHYPNVITNIEFERILNANGPFGGIIMRPSDGEIPQRIAFIQCVGSRDEGLGTNYCSNICCVAALNQSMIAMDRIEDAHITMFYTDIRPFSKNSEHFYLKAKDKYGVKFVQAKVDQVIEDAETTNLTVKFSRNGTEDSSDFDLVVLSTGIVPTDGIKRLSRQVGARLNKYGFFPNSEESPVASPGENVWFAGSITSPNDLSMSLAQASAAAAKVLQSLEKMDVDFKIHPNHKESKPHEDNNRTGVFFCRYGMSTQFNVDSDDVVKSFDKSNEHVIIRDLEYGCNTTGKQAIINAIKEENLGRVVIAPCFSDPDHETMFQQVILSAGLSADQLYIFNAENQNGGWTTEDVKQKLSRLIQEKDQKASPQKPEIKLTPEAAIIGGSLAAMQTALDIADQGFQVHLLIPGSEFADTDKKIFWHSDTLSEKTEELFEKISNHSKIRHFKQSRLKKFEGDQGKYKLVFNENGDEQSVTVGAIVVAPGAQPYEPSEFSRFESEHVVTQSELKGIIEAGRFSSKKIVMIQCVGSRQPERQYCSQICCEQSITNALKIKEIDPDAEIYILHRDIRVYDFEEDNYTEAIELGIKFIRMDKQPEVESQNEEITLHVVDRSSQEKITLNCDLIVLSNGITPHPESQKIADVLNIPLNEDGFLLENNNIMHALQSSKPGIFMAGLAHSPQRLQNVLIQATAVSGKIGVAFRRRNY